MFAYAQGRYSIIFLELEIHEGLISAIHPQINRLWILPSTYLVLKKSENLKKAILDNLPNKSLFFYRYAQLFQRNLYTKVLT